jgi:glycosyltransferase involved in cell wall biosynthesis
MTAKLACICIQLGFNSEVSVCAQLLKRRGTAYEPKVFYNAWPGHSQGAERFAAVTGIEPDRFDFGWRPPGDLGRIGRLTTVAGFYVKLAGLLKAARAFNPDVIYSSQQTWDIFAAAYLARRLGKPQIAHLHYDPNYIFPNNSLQRAAQNILRECDHVVAISDHIQRCAIKFGVKPERITTILNTIEMPETYPADTRKAVRAELNMPEDAMIVGMAARIEAWKGQGDLIQAFAQVAGAHPEAYLMIIGEGTDRPRLEQLAATTGFANRIRFTGFRSDVPRLLAAMDVFGHPSQGEPFGLAVLEASAAGIPVVAYNDGGIPEIVVDGMTGLLTPREEIPPLASALDTLLKDPARSKAMGAAGRERARNAFSPDRACRQFADLVKTAASSPSAPR